MSTIDTVIKLIVTVAAVFAVGYALVRPQESSMNVAQLLALHPNSFFAKQFEQKHLEKPPAVVSRRSLHKGMVDMACTYQEVDSVLSAGKKGDNSIGPQSHTASQTMTRNIETSAGLVRVIVERRRADVRNDVGIFWGAESSRIVDVIRDFRVTYKGRRVPIRRSAFGDLANLNEVRVTNVVGNSFEIVIGGGDASDSYVAIIRVRRGEVVSRVVKSGEFPDHHREETKYTNLTPPDP